MLMLMLMLRVMVMVMVMLGLGLGLGLGLFKWCSFYYAWLNRTRRRRRVRRNSLLWLGLFKWCSFYYAWLNRTKRRRRARRNSHTGESVNESWKCRYSLRRGRSSRPIHASDARFPSPHWPTCTPRGPSSPSGSGLWLSTTVLGIRHFARVHAQACCSTRPPAP